MRVEAGDEPILQTIKTQQSVAITFQFHQAHIYRPATQHHCPLASSKLDSLLIEAHVNNLPTLIALISSNE